MFDSGWGTLLSLGAGLVQKHLFKKLPNNVIPYTNFALTTVVGGLVTGDWQLGLQIGAQGALQATGVHQVAKTAMKKTVWNKL